MRLRLFIMIGLSILCFGVYAADYNLNQVITVGDGSGTHMGCSMAVSSDLMVVGAVAENSYAGATFVYQKQPGGWTQVAHLFLPGGVANESYGAAVAISGNDIMVSCRNEDDNIGAVYLYRWNGTTVDGPTLIANPEPSAFDLFGISVAIDGDYAVIGATGDNSSLGAAYVYHLDGGVWALQDKLVNETGVSSSNFGVMVAVSGDYLAVGAPFTSTPESQCGAVFMYRRTGGDWVYQQEVQAFNAAQDDFFGTALTLSGSTIAISSICDDDMGEESGSVYVYYLNGATWELQAKLNADDELEWDCFSSSLHMVGDMLAIGSTWAGEGGVYPGVAYLFQRSAGVWSQTNRIVAPDGVEGDQLGSSVFIDGDELLASAAYRNSGDGAIYRFFQDVTLANPVVQWQWGRRLKGNILDINVTDGLLGTILTFVVSRLHLETEPL
jgi:hypothetical protein